MLVIEDTSPMVQASMHVRPPKHWLSANPEEQAAVFETFLYSTQVLRRIQQKNRKSSRAGLTNIQKMYTIMHMFGQLALLATSHKVKTKDTN